MQDEKYDSEKGERLYQLMEEAHRKVASLPEWRRSDDVNLELRRLAETSRGSAAKSGGESE
jgi:hypothetical protein